MCAQFDRPILFASANAGKFREMYELMSQHGVALCASSEIMAGLGNKFGIAVPGSALPNVIEDGSTYLENARLKARAFFAWSGFACLGDDTGLEVLALGGRPGLHSARYAGEPSDAKRNIAKLLGEMSHLREREARFVCWLCLVQQDGQELFVDAVLDGTIATQPAGAGGFGYDSVFIVRGLTKTLAQLKAEGVSIKTHRVLAAEKLLLKLQEPRRDCSS